MELQGPTRQPVVHAGLPQGSPLSPFFSMMCLADAELQLSKTFPKVKWIAYVDDIIFYSDDDEQFRRFTIRFGLFVSQNYGFTVSGPKSRIAKQAGEWKVESIKFLGHRWFINGTLRSETRSGRSLLYNFQHLVNLGKYFSPDLLENDPLYKRLVSDPRYPGTSTYILLYMCALHRILKTWPKSQIKVFILRKLLSLDSYSKHIIRRFLSMEQESYERALE